MSEQRQSGRARLRIRLEGWRFLAHSYSLVHQWHALELSRRSSCLVGMRDLPPMSTTGPSWKLLRGVFDAADEARLSEFGDIAAPDVVVHMAFPISFRSEPPSRSFVFAPGDFGWCPRILIEGHEELRDAHARSEVVLLTPSKWSAWGLLRAGADPQRVAVVPHGVAPEIFHPAPDDIRQQLRAQRNWAEKFIFLNVSALTSNKGIDILLRSFARIAERFPNVRLVLKGNDEVYPSTALLRHATRTLTAHESRAVNGRLSYAGNTLSFRHLASLYQAADCYVAPYRAEGFNLPALEAIASGLPVICTAGGPTDDFLRDDFGFKVQAKIVKADFGPRQHEIRFQPDMEHLTALMESMIGNHSAAERARIAGPIFVRSHFTWGHAVDRLLDVISCYRRPASTWPVLHVPDPYHGSLNEPVPSTACIPRPPSDPHDQRTT